MAILAARSQLQRRPRRRVFAPPLGAPTVSLQALASLQAKALASPTGRVPLLALGALQAKARPAITGRVPLQALSSLQAKALTGPTFRASLTALAATAAKALAAPAGKVPLQAIAATMVKARAPIAFGAQVALVATAALMSMARASTPKLRAALSGLSTASAKALGAPTGKVPLLGRVALQVQAVAGFNAARFVALVARATLAVSGLGTLIAPVRQALTGFYQYVAPPSGPGAPTSFFKTGVNNTGNDSAAPSSQYNTGNPGNDSSAPSSFYNKGH